MKRLLFITLLFVSWVKVHAQSRIYLSGGVSTSLGGNFSTVLASHPAQWAVDLEWQKKIAGSVSLIAGISPFSVGYKNEDSSFGSESEFEATFVGIPLMARWNVGNRNLFYADLGFQPFYMVTANLKESVTRFGDVRTAEGDIAPYSNRLFASVKFQEVFAFNRFIVGLYIIFPFSGQSSTKDLAGHWPLNLQQSTYLLSNGYSDFYIFGFKAGMRIK